ncbi:RNA-directed DNA polymerase, eukaryota, reverse transcriptase zinc-binding domain protein [Tanacetum coccineum]
MTWIKIDGLPLCAWGSEVYKKIGGLWGKFMFFDDDTKDNPSCGKVCIQTTEEQLISETIQVEVAEVEYLVRVRETSSWAIKMDKPEIVSDSNYSLDGSEEEESNDDLKQGVSFLGVQETLMTQVKLFHLKSMWGNYQFDFACSTARGHSGGIVSLWDTAVFVKSNIHCGVNYVIVEGLVDLNIGGRNFTWMNKMGTKMSKLYRFLLSESVINVVPNIIVLALDRKWSDHIPILLHSNKVDFGPTLFRLFHSWLEIEEFNDVVVDSYNSFQNAHGSALVNFKNKLKHIKSSCRAWHKDFKEKKKARHKVLCSSIGEVERKIDENCASQDEVVQRLVFRIWNG